MNTTTKTTADGSTISVTSAPTNIGNSELIYTSQESSFTGYVAPSAGFVVAQVVLPNSLTPAANYSVLIIAAEQTIACSGGSFTVQTPGGIAMNIENRQSCMMPVRKGQGLTLQVVKHTNTSNTTNCNFYFFPLEN